RAELPMLRRLGKDLRMANWKASVTLEMRDWVYGTYLPPRLIRIYPGAFKHASMGVAIDLGTTSIVVYLMDFASGRVVDSASAYNKQISCGEDVISRIIYAKRKRGLEHLQKLAVETINDLLTELQQRNGIELYEIHEVTVAGNTTMTHLLLGLDPRHLREEPYIPTISAAPKLNAGELGLHANMLARVHVLPSVGSYVGGDITAGVISTGMYVADKLTLFIDIGTNGEMVLGNKDWLLSCACSAGPAFEGGGVRHGMRATAGAIEDVFVDDATFEPSFRTVDDAPAVGICGSGLIDLLGELFVTGLVDKSGHLDRSAPTDRVRVLDGVPEYVVCWASEGGADHDIALTESDITSLIRAKAAIYAGYEVLCTSVGVDLADVEQIFIGGAFGQYINVEKAIRIGLLPDQPPERFHFLGNTSAQGAYAALLCVNIRHDVLDVAAKMTYLELSADNSFMDEYTSALFLPHTDLDVFPTVRDKLAQRGKGAAGAPTSNGG
ncbi:MAG: ASKHA domain-containing protein, partial [Actinomycetes bacterium]